MVVPQIYRSCPVVKAAVNGPEEDSLWMEPVGREVREESGLGLWAGAEELVSRPSRDGYRSSPQV